MLESLIKLVGKELLLIPKHGPAKQGVVVYVDAQSKTVYFEDGSTIAIGFIKAITSEDHDVQNQQQKEKEASQQASYSIQSENVEVAVEPPIESKNVEVTPVSNIAVIEHLIKVETGIGSVISNLTPESIKPKFSSKLPDVIKNLDYGMGAKTDQAYLWNKINNQYHNAVKSNLLKKGSDILRVIMTDLVALVRLMPEPLLFYRMLAYFTALDDQKEHCLFALESFFLKCAETPALYEKAWYYYLGLAQEFQAYKVVKTKVEELIPETSQKTQQLLLDSLCYCLLQNAEKSTAQKLIVTYNHNNRFPQEIYSSEVATALPTEGSPAYQAFIDGWKKKASSGVVPQAKKVTKSKPNADTLTASRFSKYGTKKTSNHYKKTNIPILKEARFERDINKNYQKAAELFVKGIESEYNPIVKGGAIRDLASMLAQQMNQPDKAIEVINKYQNAKTEADLNLLYTFYFQLGDYARAIGIQKDFLRETKRNDLRLSRYINIANCYVKLESYKEAEKYYQRALNINPSQYNIERNIALCLFRQDKEAEAKKILSRIISDYGDYNSQKLLDTIEGKGEAEYSIDNVGLSLGDIDGFVSFYLDNCDFNYVDKANIDDGKYIGGEDRKKADINKLVKTASALRSRVAEERSNIYLTASRIHLDTGDKNREFYGYLCRSFASRGDDAVSGNNEMDTVRTHYLTALKVYDISYFDRGNWDEQDAVNALCRFLYSFLGRDKIPFTAVGHSHKNLSIETTVHEVLEKDIKRFCKSLPMLFSRSPQYAMKKVLRVLFQDDQKRKLICGFLKENPSKVSHFNDFVQSWHGKTKDIIKQENELHNQLVYLLDFQLTDVWLQNGIQRIKNASNSVLFSLDEEYLSSLQRLLDLCISLCKAEDYDDKYNRLEDIDSRCKDFKEQIEKKPTKLSIEEILPVVSACQSCLSDFRKDLFVTSRPELSFESTFPVYHLKEQNALELQVRVVNKADGHAEEVLLELEASQEYVKNNSLINVSYGTIKGNSSESKIIDLRLTQKAVKEKAFSAKVKANFKNRMGEQFETEWESLAIQIGEEKDFIRIEPNPYSNGASGKAVTNDEMFFGRQAYLETAYKAIIEDGSSYVIYGQFRSGKSSILSHLERKLAENDQTLVGVVGDVSAFMDEETEVPVYHRLLSKLLKSVYDGLRKKTKALSLPTLSWKAPKSKEFYEHPSPEDYYYELMDELMDEMESKQGWEDKRIIMSLDEFSYIYSAIVENKLSEDFMKSWKALLAKNYFNVVLVAQDVFPKFYSQYENAFGTIKPSRITYLDEPSAKSLIDDPIKRRNQGESKFRENAIAKIIELTAGHPWYIQIFCYELVEYINQNKQPYITGANIDKVKDLLLRGESRQDNFKNFIENGDPSSDRIPDQDFIKILKRIAIHTKNDEYCTTALLSGCNTTHPTVEVLEDLKKREVIAAHPEKGYKIRVGLFKEWLNENPNAWE